MVRERVSVHKGERVGCSIEDRVKTKWPDEEKQEACFRHVAEWDDFACSSMICSVVLHNRFMPAENLRQYTLYSLRTERYPLGRSSTSGGQWVSRRRNAGRLICSGSSSRELLAAGMLTHRENQGSILLSKWTAESCVRELTKTVMAAAAIFTLNFSALSPTTLVSLHPLTLLSTTVQRMNVEK